MWKHPFALENLNNYLVHILVFLGAVGGSLKASLHTHQSGNNCGVRTLNILIGVFCGVVVAGHYHHQVTPFIAGILSWAVGSVSVVVLESVISLAPGLVQKFLERWLDKKI